MPTVTGSTDIKMYGLLRVAGSDAVFLRWSSIHSREHLLHGVIGGPNKGDDDGRVSDPLGLHAPGLAALLDWRLLARGGVCSSGQRRVGLPGRFLKTLSDIDAAVDVVDGLPVDRSRITPSGTPDLRASVIDPSMRGREELPRSAGDSGAREESRQPRADSRLVHRR